MTLSSYRVLLESCLRVSDKLWFCCSRFPCHNAHSPILQCLKAGDLVTWDPNGNGYYVTPHNKWYVEAGKYDEKGAGGGLGQWDRDHHFDVWGKVRY